MGKEKFTDFSGRKDQIKKKPELQQEHWMKDTKETVFQGPRKHDLKPRVLGRLV